ncbi:MAG: UDP-2,3-diacylglucosamine diphosphatase [Gammaproteobacteria bacterium]|nr:UDP-2,3-diacylglucosamine diphosphatase [Gammaproteobacteria bacterium]
MPTDEQADGVHKYYRALFISDVHLGSKGCQAEALAEFLKFHHAPVIYLVGDIVDGWRLKKRHFWPQSHTDVIRRLFTKAKRGSRIVYVTGNHDDFLRRYSGIHFGNIELCDEVVHETLSGQKLRVLHGDAYDGVVTCHKWLALLGDWAYESMLHVNRWYNKLRQYWGFGYWSLSAYLKHRVKRAVMYMHEYEHLLMRDAHKAGFDGVVCGHIHHAEIRQTDQGWYGNCGDWVESCTALVEHEDGRMDLLRYHATVSTESSSS